MKNKLAMKTLALAAVTSMVASGVPIAAPITVQAKTTYETNESLKPDADAHVTVHDLSKIADTTWKFDSEDPKKPSQIKWDSGTSTLTIQYLDLNVTNADLASWMSYFTYSGVNDLNVVLKGTNNLTLNGNVCFIQATGQGGIKFTSNGAKNAGSLYVNMNAASASDAEGTKSNECHFIESYSHLDFGDDNDPVNVSITTKGAAINAHTNIYAKGDINIKGKSYIYSSIEASSSRLSSNAIATLGNMNVAKDATLTAKCNVADTTTPYFTVNNALLVNGTYNDAGSKLYVTNVNGHVINCKNIKIADVKAAAEPSVTYKTDQDGKTTSEVDNVKIKIGGNTYDNDISKVPEGTYLFYSDTAFVTDANNFIATTHNDKTNVNYLSYTLNDKENGDFFNHANITPANIPKTAKTLMTNNSMNLVSKSSQATAGVGYDNGDIIISIADETVNSIKNGTILIDGKIVDMDEWGDAISISDQYTAIKIEGGTINASQAGVVYIRLSKEFGQSLGAGTHTIEIRTANGIISTTITVPESDSATGDTVNSTDAYGKIISVTKNEAGDIIYTYDTGIVRVVSFDKAGNKSDITITFANGNVLVKHADGTSTLTQPDGSVTSYDKDGKVTNIYNAGGNKTDDGNKDDNKTDTSTENTISNDSKALDLAIGSVSSGYTHTAVKDSIMKSATAEMKKITPDKKTSKLAALSDIELDKTNPAKANADGKYEVQLNIASITAADSIKLLHQLSDGTWEQITPTTVGNGYVSAQLSSLSSVAVVKLEDVKSSTDDSKEDDSNKDTPSTNNSYTVTTDISRMYVNKLKDITLTVNAPLSKLSASNQVTIDGKTLGTSEFTATSSGDKTVIVLKANGLASGLGAHNIVVNYTDGTAKASYTLDLNDSSNTNPTTPTVSASETAKKLDANVTSLTSGFTHEALTSDSTVNSANNAVTSLKGMSTDGYTLAALTKITKGSGTSDGIIIMGIADVKAGNTVRLLAQQTDGTFKEISATVGSDGKVSFNSTNIGNGVIAAVKVTKTISDSAKQLDAGITKISAGFTHTPVDDTVVNTAKNKMLEIKGSSSNVYSLATISNIAKNSGTSDNALITLTIPAVDAKDTVFILAQQANDTWSDITATASIGEDVVAFPSYKLGNGNIAVVKTVANNSSNNSGNSNSNTSFKTDYSVVGNVLSMKASDMKNIELTINAPYSQLYNNGISAIDIDGKVVSTDYTLASSGSDKTILTLNAKALNSTVGNHIISIKFANGTAKYVYIVTNDNGTTNNGTTNNGSNNGINNGTNNGTNSGSNAGNNTNGSNDNSSDDNSSKGNSSKGDSSKNDDADVDSDGTDTDDTKGSDDASDDSDGSTTTSKEEAESEGTSTAANTDGEQKATAKSARTGQTLVSMFIEYLLHGLNLR